MKHLNPSLSRLLVLLAVVAGCATSRAADAEPAANVLSPTKRQEAIDAAAKLLAQRTPTAVANDPFHPAGFDELVASMGRPSGTTTTPTPGESTSTQPVGPRNDRDLLVAMATALKSPNVIVLGGQPTLLFGQKRVKAGGTVTITFEGTQYTLEITNIAPPNFTLRLNREEFTRTIK